MKKKPEVDGKWVEVEAKDLLSKKDEMANSEILVVTTSRVEFGGSDKVEFEKKFLKMEADLSSETEGMDDEQRSFYILKKMLLG